MAQSGKDLQLHTETAKGKQCGGQHQPKFQRAAEPGTQQYRAAEFKEQLKRQGACGGQQLFDERGDHQKQQQINADQQHGASTVPYRLCQCGEKRWRRMQDRRCTDDVSPRQHQQHQTGSDDAEIQFPADGTVTIQRRTDAQNDKTGRGKTAAGDQALTAGIVETALFTGFIQKQRTAGKPQQERTHHVGERVALHVKEPIEEVGIQMIKSLAGMQEADEDHRYEHAGKQRVPPDLQRVPYALANIAAKQQQQGQQRKQQKMFQTTHVDHHFQCMSFDEQNFIVL